MPFRYKENRPVPPENTGMPPLIDVGSYIRVGNNNSRTYDYLNLIYDHSMVTRETFEQFIQVLLKLGLTGEKFIRMIETTVTNEDDGRYLFNSELDFFTDTLNNNESVPYQRALKKAKRYKTTISKQ